MSHDSGTAGIQARDVHKTYRLGPQRVRALRGLHLTVEPGTLVMLKGRSGAGKSTLLNLLAGLDRPDSGSIVVAGTSVTEAGENDLVAMRRDNVASIYQGFALLPLLTAEENVGVPLRIAAVPARERDARVAELLDKVGLAEHGKQRPDELSGGQMQRVAIARALACNPQVVLADEPTGQLDTDTGSSVMELLRGLVDTDGVTLLVASHDAMLERYVDRVVHLVDGTIGYLEPGSGLPGATDRTGRW